MWAMKAVFSIVTFYYCKGLKGIWNIFFMVVSWQAQYRATLGLLSEVGSLQFVLVYKKDTFGVLFFWVLFFVCSVL